MDWIVEDGTQSWRPTSALRRDRRADARGPQRVQLVERTTGRGNEQKWKQGVHHRRESADRHARTEQKGEAAMLRVGLADGRRMGGKEIAHDIPLGRYRAAI